VVVSLVAEGAVLVDYEGDADQERPQHKRPELAHLRPCHAAGGGALHRNGIGDQLREGDEDEGAGAQQKDDRDVGLGERLAQRQDDDRADNGGQRGQEVVGERLRRERGGREAGERAGASVSTRRRVLYALVVNCSDVILQ